MNVSQPTIDALHVLTGKMFQQNRDWDSAMSVLKVNFTCDNVVKYVHPYIAHAYPILADRVTEILEMFNILAIYPATTDGYIDYVDVLSVMERMLEKTLDLQNAVMGAMEVAIANKDYLVKVELDKILLEMNQQVSQIILMRDKALQYGDNIVGYDHDFDTFFFLNKEKELGDD